GGSGWSLPREVLDLRDVVHDGGDAGLIGIVADPGFADNGFVYLSLVRDDGEVGDEGAGVRRTQQVVRYTWDGTALDPDSRHVVLGDVTGPACSSDEGIRTPGCIPLLGEAHTIGDLGFDDEGHLLVGVGDGSLYYTADGLPGRPETLRAQDPEVLAGKVLRVDPATGEGVPGNPLYDGDGSTNASRVLALGLRNPFRFTVHDGHLVIGDVGEGSAEEVDVVELHDPATEGPANFGWPCREGETDTALGDVSGEESPWHACAAVRADAATRSPSYSYPHTGAGGSISGGVFLDSEAYPPAMRGRYVFGDYAQGFIRTADVAHGGAVSDPAPLADASAAAGPVKFLTGPDGLVWTVSITTGALRRIRWTGAGQADQCPVGTFRRTFHDLDGDDSPFDEEIPEGPYSWLLPYAAVQLPSQALAAPTCEPAVQLATDGSPWATPEQPDTRAHPGDRFGTAWRGRVALDAGTWRFTVTGSEWVRLWVDDQVVHDFWSNGFWPLAARQHDVVLGPGQHLVRAELVHGDETSAEAEVTWTRVGGPPVVSLDAPANGTVATDGTVPWTITVTDPDGDPVADLAERTRLEVDVLHYTGDAFHAHPSSRIDGQLTGTLPVSDVHAPGSAVVRLRASVIDASGARSVSTPVYVCFAGGAVGPCAER
ncbi:MAG TPA: PQQ-dependent sugar dehydrogenase, partial [Nocardioides sp.]|nr:PQQ-dependent sugar dehydrogenase [Nocardioides sp.]